MAVCAIEGMLEAEKYALEIRGKNSEALETWAAIQLSRRYTDIVALNISNF